MMGKKAVTLLKKVVLKKPECGQPPQSGFFSVLIL